MTAKPGTSRRGFLIAAATMGATTIDAATIAPVIDCHTHVGTGTNLISPWTTIGDPEEILRRNKEAGIDKACIFPISHETFEEPNREVARIMKRHPGRFIGYAKHDPVNEKGHIRAML